MGCTQNLSYDVLERYGGEYVPYGVVESGDHVVYFDTARGIVSGEEGVNFVVYREAQLIPSFALQRLYFQVMKMAIDLEGLRGLAGGYFCCIATYSSWHFSCEQ